MSAERYDFPIIAIGESKFAEETHGDRRLEIYDSEASFSYVSEFQLKPGMRESLDVFDAQARHFKVRGFTPIKAHRKGFLHWLMRWERFYDIRHDVELQPPISFDALREQVVASILSDPERWVDDEIVAGESGEPREPEDILADRVARVRAAPDFQALIEVLESED